ncbi:MAG: hypothetical protein QOF74_2767 [Caballeronia mineralivorans]|jgi:hypothetical protein|nr:hypothetical protein [Caballeronia mineralivorans]
MAIDTIDLAPPTLVHVPAHAPDRNDINNNCHSGTPECLRRWLHPCRVLLAWTLFNRIPA